MEPVTAAKAFTFERELIAEVEHLNGTDLHLFGVEITAATLQGVFPNTTLIIDFIDRRSSTEVDRYQITLWTPSLWFQDADGRPSSPESAATVIYAELIEG